MKPKVYLKLHRSATNLYLEQLLKYWITLNGIQLVEFPEDADSLWVSICDLDELPMLRGLRKKFPKKEIVMGGFESYAGVPYLGWANYVVVGEGWGFINLYGKDPKAAKELPNVLSLERYRTQTPIIPDYFIPYDKLPLIQVGGKNRFYYLGGKGCHKKCAFCMTSWVQPLQTNDKPRLEKAVKTVEAKRGKLTIIQNDSRDVISSKVVNAQSVTVDDYILTPAKYRSNMLHFGVEGWTEEARKLWHKPIPNEKIKTLMDVTKEYKQECEFFMIANYPGFENEHIDQFIEEALTVDIKHQPPVHMKITYFDIAPHIPWKNNAVPLNYVNPKKVFEKLMQKNMRFRVFPMRSVGREAWRSVIRRCTPEEALRLGSDPMTRNDDKAVGKFIKQLKNAGLTQKLDVQTSNPNDLIKCSVKPIKKPADHT